MRLKAASVRDGLHPSEVIVGVRTEGGEEFLTLDRHSVQDGTIDIGYPIDEQGGMFLVELPRETMTGTWRVWVGRDGVEREPRRAYA